MISTHPAKQYLLEIRKYDVLIDRKMQESKMWKERATSITSPAAGVKVSKSMDPYVMEAAIVKSIDAEREADRYLAEKYKRIHLIEKLEDSDQIEMLYKMYVDGKSLQDVVNDDYMGRSYSWARKVHGSALKSLLELLERGKD